MQSLVTSNNSITNDRVTGQVIIDSITNDRVTGQVIIVLLMIALQDK
jgi:hypothetical protein